MEIFQNHPLAPYTTVKIGGPADTFIITDTTEEFIEVLKKYHPLTILGNGSNVLISDSGIRGTVVKNRASKIEYLPENRVRVDSGVQLPFLISDTVNHSLSGLEEFSYIPSTIGGAIFGNIHGVNKNNFDKFVEEIEVFDLKTNSLVNFSVDKLHWDYDYSDFQNNSGWIIISVTIKLTPGDSTISKQSIAEIITKKTATQSMNSLGSVFKNPPNDSAGRIIDQELNLKGFQLNQVQVSPTHANFIVNLGTGTATDYLALIKKIQSEAKSKLNIDLEPEIKFLGNFN